MGSSNADLTRRLQDMCRAMLLMLMLMLGPRSKHHRRVPECFPDHVFVGDAVVGQGLAPHRVQRVAQGLGSKFIGLEDKRKTFSRVRLEEHWAPLELAPQVSGKFCQKTSTSHKYVPSCFAAVK